MPTAKLTIDTSECTPQSAAQEIVRRLGLA